MADVKDSRDLAEVQEEEEILEKDDDDDDKQEESSGEEKGAEADQGMID